MSFEDPKNEGAVRREWFERAKVKAESFLPRLDPNLHVEVKTVHVTTLDDEEYDTLTLSFSHALNPDFKWTMEIEMTDEYLENDFEKAVRRSYAEQSLDETAH